MIFIPDPNSAVMDPFLSVPTLSLTCDIVDAITKQPYPKDPRTIAAKAEAYLKSTGIGDTSYFGPEPEFFVFDEVRYSEGPNRSSYMVDSVEGRWNTDREEGPNLGYKPAHKGGYFPVPPTDTLTDLRTEMALMMEAVGIPVEVFHHEVASGGQCELSMKFNSLKYMADWTMWYKYIVKNVSRKHGKTATFMPKPIFQDNGSGMHCHQSIWKDEKNLFAGDKYAGLSDMALNYIGGILKHAPALCAFTNPGTNSYKRLVPGYEAPVNLAYSSRNRSASVRIPIGSDSPKSQAPRVPLPRPDRQPVHRVLGDADGRPRRHPEQDRPGQAARQGHLRAVARGIEGRSEGAGLAGRGAQGPRARPRVPPQGRRVHRPTSSRPGSTTSVRTRWTRSGCVRTRTSSRCTSTTSRFRTGRPVPNLQQTDPWGSEPPADRIRGAALPNRGRAAPFALTGNWR